MSTFKELLESVAPQRWKSNGGTVRIDSPDKYKQERICTIPSPSGAAPEAWEEISNRREHVAQYIARLNPETMKLVLEALEYDMTHNSNSRLSRIALRALNTPSHE